MTSFTLARRLLFIILVSGLVLWLLAVVLSYAGDDWKEQNFGVSPRRLANIVDLIEMSSGSARTAAIAALNTPTLSIQIIDLSDALQADREPREVNEELAKKYSGAFAGRAFTVASYRGIAPTNGLIRFFAPKRTVIVFRIGIDDHRTLMIINTDPVISTALGFPIGLLGGLVGSMVALVALLALYNEIRPLAQLAQAVDRIDLEGGPVPLPTLKRQTSEIKALVRAFDRLQLRLSQLIHARMVLIAGISHDVRTFATRLHLRTDAIPNAESRERAANDIRDMITMLDDALLAARCGVGDLDRELLDLGSLLQEEVNSRRSLNIPVELETNPDSNAAMILGETLALRRMIGNLIDNAVKYGKVAYVSAYIDYAFAVLAIEDDGPGMPADVASLLTEPFVRGEDSRNRATGDAGLGLAIAKSVAGAHEGTLSILKAPQRGARVEIRIPLYEF